MDVRWQELPVPREQAPREPRESREQVPLVLREPRPAPPVLRPELQAQ